MRRYGRDWKEDQGDAGREGNDSKGCTGDLWIRFCEHDIQVAEWRVYAYDRQHGRAGEDLWNYDRCDHRDKVMIADTAP